MASEWAAVILLSANLAWTTLCLGGVRSETMVMGWLLTGAALALVILREILAERGAHWAPLYLAPFVACAFASALLVSPVRWLGERDAWHWLQMLATFAIALDSTRRAGPRRLVLATIAALGATALALSCYQLAGHESWLMLGRTQALQYIGRASGFFGNPNTLAAFFALLIPPCIALVFRRGASGVLRAACAYFAAALLLGLALTMSRGGMLALALALLCWPWIAGDWSPAKRARAFAAALAFIAIASSALWFAAPPMRERMRDFTREHGEKSRAILWQASLKMTASAPLLGTGAGSFNTLFEKHRPEGFRDDPQWAHNDFLNTLSDYGIAGCALLLGGIVAIARRSGRGRPEIPPHAYPAALREHAALTGALGVGLLAFCFACLADFHQKIPALAMLAAVFAAEIVRRRESLRHAEQEFAGPPAQLAPAAGPLRKTTPDLRRRILACAALLLLALCVRRVVNIHRAEALRATGREKINALAKENGLENNPEKHAQTLIKASLCFAEALQFHPGNAQAWADHAYAEALRARENPGQAAYLGKFAGEFAREAIARSEVVPEFWLRLGVALDLQGRSTEAGDAFARALALAPASALVWYHQAYHLSLTPASRPLALGAAEICLRLDPAYADADSLRQQLLNVR